MLNGDCHKLLVSKFLLAFELMWPAWKKKVQYGIVTVLLQNVNNLRQKFCAFILDDDSFSQQLRAL